MKPRLAPTRRRRALLVAAGLGLGVLAGYAAVQVTRPRTVTLSGESEGSSPVFRLTGRPYLLSAELQPTCQYTFYLTPAGQLWNRAGRPVASASGETGLNILTPALPAGLAFIHTYTAPEEGCSWSLRLRPR